MDAQSNMGTEIPEGAIDDPARETSVNHSGFLRTFNGHVSSVESAAQEAVLREQVCFFKSLDAECRFLFF